MSDDDREDEDDDPRGERNRFQRFGDQLQGLLDPEAALRRGTGIVTGVSKATRDELMRIVGAEVRRFLDNIEIADLAQEIVAGLVVDVNMQVKFSRDDNGDTQPVVTKSEANVRSDGDPPSNARKDRNHDEASSDD
jgi:hypothetical protein